MAKAMRSKTMVWLCAGLMALGLSACVPTQTKPNKPVAHRVNPAIAQASALAKNHETLSGQAKADAYQAGVTSLGSDVYGMLQAFQIIADKNLRVVPDVLVNGGANNNGILEALMAMMTKQRPALPSVN